MTHICWWLKPRLHVFNAAFTSQLWRPIQLSNISMLNKWKLHQNLSVLIDHQLYFVIYSHILSQEGNLANGLALHDWAARWCRATILSAAFPLISCLWVHRTVSHDETQCLCPAVSIIFRYYRNNKTSTSYLHTFSTVTKNLGGGGGTLKAVVNQIWVKYLKSCIILLEMKSSYFYKEFIKVWTASTILICFTCQTNDKTNMKTVDIVLKNVHITNKNW